MFAGQMAWGRRILPDDPTSKIKASIEGGPDESHEES